MLVGTSTDMRSGRDKYRYEISRNRPKLQRRYTLSGDKLFYIVRQYLMLRATSYLNSASVPNRRFTSRGTPLTHAKGQGT
ncbi:hypothetical protein BHE74_00003198 [Ensete ventricosum]|nr:hypothetical protein BHE74_00003198 [Ensete ventricosum]